MILFLLLFGTWIIYGRDEASALYTNNDWKAFPDISVEPAYGPFFDPHAPRIIMVWLGMGPIPGNSIHRLCLPPADAFRGTSGRCSNSSMDL